MGYLGNNSTLTGTQNNVRISATATADQTDFTVGGGYQIAGYGSITGALNPIVTDVNVRLAIPHLPTFLPHGVAEHPGLHNVPLRIAVENGIIAAAIWIVITAWALISKTNNEPLYR